ncbi:MAG: hypothetical protein ACKOYN_05145, partial [Planctomycetota bacterium]
MDERQPDQVDLSADRGVFRAEYERELGQWLRRRLGYLCIAYAVFQTLSMTMLILVSVWAQERADAPRDRVPLPTAQIERRAEAAERRADAGLPPIPGDRRAVELARELEEREKRRLERDRGAEAIVSTLDAFSELARDFTEDLRDPPKREPRHGAAPAMRPMDRWWNDALAPGGAVAAGRGEVATPADAPALASTADDARGDDAAAPP